MTRKDAGPQKSATTSGPAPGIDGRALEPAVRVAVLEALPPVVTVESAEGED
jgi:hypothetical protein